MIPRVAFRNIEGITTWKGKKVVTDEDAADPALDVHKIGMNPIPKHSFNDVKIAALFRQWVTTSGEQYSCGRDLECSRAETG